MIKAPYLLYLGGSNDPLSVKTAQGIMTWRPELVIGETAPPDMKASVGAERMSIEEGFKRGAKTLIIGYANGGGYIDPDHLSDIVCAIELGLDVASGMHHRLQSHDRIEQAAKRCGIALHNVRIVGRDLPVGTGEKRSGNRLLSVGTDCSVGKMYVALSIHREMLARKIKADFRATGQTGILIEGSGISVDAVIADFISGSVEVLSPARTDEGWDIIEGQGSLFHPAYAGVSLGLLHGAQPDRLVMCHEPGRPHMRNVPGRALPDLRECISANLCAARLVNPAVKMAGVALNTKQMDAATAKRSCQAVEDQTGLPCQDPLRDGMRRIVDNVLD